MNSPLIHCPDLRMLQESGGVVIDVMTPEDYASCHIAGAINCCIYEVVFLDQVRSMVPDKDTEVVVYDATGTTATAQTARQRLLDAGYRNVSLLIGGLAAWLSQGLPVEGACRPADFRAVLPKGTYRADTDIARSRLEWTGRSVSSRHFGRISLLEGQLQLDRGMVESGHFILDMRTITDLDLEDPAYRHLLESHLSSEDFFAVDRYPTATLRLGSSLVQRFEAPDIFRLRMAGDLTIRKVTRPVFFPATLIPRQDGCLSLHAALTVDRVLWDVSYGSSRLFERLGMHLVDDEISLELFVTAAGS